MTFEYPPLLNQSSEPPQSPSRQHYLNRTMSLRAALLAFPLPTPSQLSPPRHHKNTKQRISPLKSYNSNYTRLSQARELRLQQRQSTIATKDHDPIYTMPTSCASIQREFPHNVPIESASSIKSMAVEIDDTQPFEIFEDPPHPSRERNRHRATLLSSGNIAHRQYLRRKKDPKEISINILRKTGTFVGKNIVKRARDTISSTFSGTGQNIFRSVKNKLKRRDRYGASENNGVSEGGDELHKYFYDLHGGEHGYVESIDSKSGMFENESDKFDTNVDDEGSGANDGEILGDNKKFGHGYVPEIRRRQTWTNLSSVLMDETPMNEDLNVQEKIIGDDTGGLTTIEEVYETSHCGRLSTFPHPSSVNTNTAQWTQYLQSLALSLQSSNKSPAKPISPDPVPGFISDPSSPNWEPANQWEDTTTSSSSPSKSLRQLSPATQDIFDITRAETTYNSGISDPVKPTKTINSQPSVSRYSGVETTRPSSQYSDILPQSPLSEYSKHCKDSRHAESGEARGQFSLDNSMDSRGVSYSSSLLRERPLSSKQNSSERQILKLPQQITYRHISNQPSLHPPQLSLPPLQFSENKSQDFHTEISGKEIVGKVCEAEEGDFGTGDRGKSVKERVRELDMAIDHAMSFNSSPVKKAGGLFSRWN